MDKLLEVSGLKTWFHTDQDIVKAVDDISFDLFRGETLGIVGESGSGKSVTALSIMGLITQPPGEIMGGAIKLRTGEDEYLDLIPLSAKKMVALRGNRLGMVFQEPMSSLNPVFRCGHQVQEAILIHRPQEKSSAKKLVLELFDKVHLPDPERIYRAYPHQLSGGQKQRVMIAMALSCQPDILIADEPTTALDVTVQKTILNLMSDLKKQFSGSIIFITHDLGVIAEIADRVLVMHKGKIVEQGSVEDIFLRPQHSYTKGLLACRPPLDFRLKRLPVVSDFLNRDQSDENIEDVAQKQLSLKISSEEHEKRLQTLASNPLLLKVTDLSVWFPGKKDFWGNIQSHIKAVDEVSFELRKGETLGLVGESGCGKTTLGRAILRLQAARSGRVEYEGQNILELSNKEMKALRKEMQIIFQDPFAALNPRLMIGNALMEPIAIHHPGENSKRCKEKAIELLETVGLETDHFYRYPHQFSGGQRQRICIARALAVNPRFIVCDESVSALDVSVQAQILNLLMDLRENHQLTYIFISHDLSVVKLMSDRILVMDQGKIVESGPADDIYKNPKDPYTKKLIAAIPKNIFEK
ncbi:MAG: ABC transporter ATP-binding protein [Saprospiraceae bacterium]|nr:MAG: ABC transporter ATP-binding protein [Saprospiraceae bacterium]